MNKVGTEVQLPRYSYKDGVVIVNGNGRITKESIDTWTSLMIGIIQRWNQPGPICIISDHSGMREGFTAYARTKVDEILSSVPRNREAFLVAVVPDNIINHLVRVFMATRLLNGARVRVVHSQDAAWAWMKRMIKWSNERFK